jgi:uncharacterized protein (DUF983 family)
VRLAPLTRGLRKRCPNCGAADLFTSFFTIRSRCPECHVVFEREEGYWLGAMIVAIGVTEALFGVWFVAGMLLTWPDVPWTMLLIGGLVLNATIPVISYPWSKTTWMGLHHAFVPPDAAEEADAIASRDAQARDGRPSTGLDAHGASVRGHEDDTRGNRKV